MCVGDYKTNTNIYFMENSKVMGPLIGLLLGLFLGGFTVFFSGRGGGGDRRITPEEILKFQKQGILEYHEFLGPNLGLRGLGHIINKRFKIDIESMARFPKPPFIECSKEGDNLFKIKKRFNIGTSKENLDDHGALEARIKVFNEQELFNVQSTKITLYDLDEAEKRNVSNDKIQISISDYHDKTINNIDSSFVNIEVETILLIPEEQTSPNFNLVLDAIDLDTVYKKTMLGYIEELIHANPEECEELPSKLGFYNCVDESNTHHADHVEIMSIELCN